MIVALARKVCPSAKSAHGHGGAAAAMMLPSLSTKIVPAVFWWHCVSFFLLQRLDSFRKVVMYSDGTVFHVGGPPARFVCLRGMSDCAQGRSPPHGCHAHMALLLQRHVDFWNCRHACALLPSCWRVQIQLFRCVSGVYRRLKLYHAWQWLIRFFLLHVFAEVTVAKAAVWKGIKCDCFCLGPAPFFLLVCFLGGETQVWLGDLRVVWFLCCCLVWL